MSCVRLDGVSIAPPYHRPSGLLVLHGASEHHVAAVRIRVDAARLHAQPDQVDGERVAFSGQYNGQTDIYVVPVDGGTPERLAWHPSSSGASWRPAGARPWGTGPSTWPAWK